MGEHAVHGSQTSLHALPFMLETNVQRRGTSPCIDTFVRHTMKLAGPQKFLSLRTMMVVRARHVGKLPRMYLCLCFVCFTVL